MSESKKIKASHILVEKKPKAEEVLEKIRQGESFSEMAKKHSKGPSGKRGGNLGFFTRGKMVKEFEQAAFSLDKGEVSDIVKTKFGYHIIKRTE